MSKQPATTSSTNSVLQPLALWGGIECTVNRVGDTYQDQLMRNGHHHRDQDLFHVAQLGLKTLRYPLLWERTAPERVDQPDWQWADRRLGVLQELGIRPIIGLVHHGCGPKYATFAGPEFERQLPRYARQVAERYPWVDAYTPVNEPLTTARFSGLNGHWYPHANSPRVFVDILLRQCRATVLAMQQIRQVRPDAQLIQTDDLGQTHSSPKVNYQAEWENHRRWLSWDLLCGYVTKQHPLWDYLRWVGIPYADLAFFVDNPCPPSVIGINHYITSERYLDERIWQYPVHMQGGNERDRYVDTEVVRAAPEQRVGLTGLLQQAWKRYQRPIAVTEAHLGCTVDEQMRWLWDMWQQTQQARQAGADIQAVTAWALLGSFDWHCLLTRHEGYYEPGAFDVSSGYMQATPLAELIQCLATGQNPAELVPPGPGWWQIVPQPDLA
ncbi:dTDP-4-dehydrorhamnose reductase [Larkinella arboricola]|uniref:dTDP-4-dehydrorhamnose reductase n=1 Tax=Larkinella arboricola TaxID=643671 RepID=A0A327WR68_LARAB|nr:family 1 glycosylhydrolase [Larkinella arboricola]RAJ94123.1 dTDP-4-dehydrorhamnose reductase [Larkinella arboricola]